MGGGNYDFPTFRGSVRTLGSKAQLENNRSLFDHLSSSCFVRSFALYVHGIFSTMGKGTKRPPQPGVGSAPYSSSTQGKKGNQGKGGQGKNKCGFRLTPPGSRQGAEGSARHPKGERPAVEKDPLANY